jgi:MFS family permease
MVVTNGGDPVVTRLVQEDKVPWYKKKNLRNLYLLLFPTCMGIETTSGFDSQLINSLQGVAPWKKYFGKCVTAVKEGKSTTTCKLEPSLAGIVAASYSLGAICALPFIPMFNQRYGRRWSIFFGSAISIVGAIIQGLSVHGTSITHPGKTRLTRYSWDVYRGSDAVRFWYSILHYLRISNDWRAGIP